MQVEETFTVEGDQAGDRAEHDRAPFGDPRVAVWTLAGVEERVEEGDGRSTRIDGVGRGARATHARAVEPGEQHRVAARDCDALVVEALGLRRHLDVAKDRPRERQQRVEDQSVVFFVVLGGPCVPVGVERVEDGHRGAAAAVAIGRAGDDAESA